MRVPAAFYGAILMICGMQLATAGPMTQRDREHLVAHLQMTGSWLPDEVSSLSAAQLNFRSAPGKWTIAEVVQHLVIAEPNYWQLLKKGKLKPSLWCRNFGRPGILSKAGLRYLRKGPQSESCCALRSLGMKITAVLFFEANTKGLFV